MNEPIRMRLRSGIVVEAQSRSEAIEEPNDNMDRPDDTLSTAATWGTPLTASQSTVGSGSALGSQQERANSSSSQQAQGSQSNEPTYVPTEAPQNAEERPVDAPFHPGNGHASSSAQGPVTSRPLPPLPSQQQQPDMLHRFSTDDGPWHASPTMIPVDHAERSKRRLSEVEGMEGFQLDRDYPDKLTVELEEMGQKAGDGDGDGDGDAEEEEHDGHDSKKRKTVRRSKRRGDDKAGPRGRGRGDKSGGGNGGEGLML